MKCLGLIGGIGWESTAAYYRIINVEARNRYGSLHSARLIVNSLGFAGLDTMARSGRWDEAGAVLSDAARTLERAGAEGIVICSNLMHFVAAHVESSVSIPLLHVGDAILGETRKPGVRHIGLLGTRFVLENEFLLNRPARGNHPRKAQTYIPKESDRERLDSIIYGELCTGLVRESTRTELLRMSQELRDQGARIVVLASSELSTALKPEDFAPHLFDSTELHALMAARWAMEGIQGCDYRSPRLTAVPGAPLTRLARKR